MLQYEWRPGRAVETNDTVLSVEDDDHIDLVIPDPITQETPTTGPNPLQVIDPDAPPPLPNPVIHQGVRNNDPIDHIQNNVLQDQENVDEAHHDNQGVLNNEIKPIIQEIQQDTHQGVSLQPLKPQGVPHNPETVLEDVTNEDSDDEDDEIYKRRKQEKERRSEHLKVHEGEEYGRGRRERKQTTNFSFLQTRFEDLTK